MNLKGSYPELSFIVTRDLVDSKTSKTETAPGVKPIRRSLLVKVMVLYINWAKAVA